jgi:hypothetical protein
MFKTLYPCWTNLTPSRPCSEFLAKILDVSTSPFDCNTQFYFTQTSLLLHRSFIKWVLSSSPVAEWVAYFLVVWLTRVWFSHFFLTHRVYNGYGDCNISFTSKSLHLFSFHLLLTFEKGGTQLVSQCERLKIHWYFTTVKLTILSK